MVQLYQKLEILNPKRISLQVADFEDSLKELTFEEMDGFTFNINQVYAPIQDKAWLPVSHQFGVEGSILGIGLTYNYLATVSDYAIELNPDLDVDFRVIDEKIEKELAKLQR